MAFMAFKVGDKEQRYEVRYTDGEGIERVMGWADDPKNLVKAIQLHPSFHSPKVIDRKKRHGGCWPEVKKVGE